MQIVFFNDKLSAHFCEDKAKTNHIKSFHSYEHVFFAIFILIILNEREKTEAPVILH